MGDSILTSVKKSLGIIEEYEHFDPELIMYINTAFSTLNQLGVGPEEGFTIVDKSASWSDFIPSENSAKLELVKTYVCLKVRLIFDPPSSSAVMESINKMISECEWRINIVVDKGKEESENE